MKIDYRVMGRPFRGTRRVVCIRSGFATRDEAEQYMQQQIDAESMDPYAYVRAQRVRDDYDPTKVVHIIQVF